MSATLRVWIVDEDPAACWVLERALEGDGLTPRIFDAAPAVLAALEHDAPDVLFTEIDLNGQSGLELLRAVHNFKPALPVIVTAGNPDLNSAVSSYKAGAFEYLPKPLDVLEALSVMRRAARARPFVNSMRDPVHHISEILGRAPAMQAVFRTIGRLAESNVPVLINGESGTGKELIARALHYHSPRAGGPFVPVNMSAIAPGLLESEIFGQEAAEFLGAIASRTGRLEQAQGGTLFLEAIDALEPQLQTRLLQFLVEGELYRKGRSVPIRANVRLIAATRQDLCERVRLGLFRSDLYYRLGAVHVELPPLRFRPEDVPKLASHYMQVAAGELGVAPKSFTPETLNRLADYDWPGNVRELADLCRRLCVVGPGSEIAVQHLPPHLRPIPVGDPEKAEWVQALAAWSDRKLALGEYPLHAAAEPEFERVLMNCALKQSQGRRHEAAKIIGWSRNTLLRKYKSLGEVIP
jgi:two-component system, NtrC family, nitrogen regulation response regulator GlnG